MKSVYIISAERASQTDEQNAIAYREMAKILQHKGLRYTTAVGVSKQWGMEQSFIVISGEGAMDFFHGLRDQFGQDAFMFVDNRGLASIEFKGESCTVGLLRSTTNLMEVGQRDYTRVYDHEGKATYFYVQ